MPSATAIRPFVSLIVMSLLSGCDFEMPDSFDNLLEIRQAVVDVLETDEVSISLKNQSLLQITVPNSRYNASSESERRQAADRAAATAYTIYDNPMNLGRVQIVFVSVEQKMAVVTYTETIDSFEYRNKQLQRLAAESERDST